MAELQDKYLGPLFVFIVHLRQNIATDLIVFLSHVELRCPSREMVQVVLELVVLRETPKIAVLHLMQILDFGSTD